jgi:hypothetical protein
MNTYLTNTLNGTAAESTILKRVAFLRLLSDRVDGSKDMSFLNSTGIIMKRINDTDNVETRWNRMMNIVKAIEVAPHLINARAKALYDKEIEKLKDARIEIRDKNAKTPKQVVRLQMGLNERQQQLDDLFDTLFNNYELPMANIKAIHIERLRRDDQFVPFVKQFQDLLIMACYLYQPALRNDWGEMKIVSKIRGIANDQNYLYVSSGKMELVLQVYKNVKKLGKMRINVRPKLRKLLKIWIDLLGKTVDNPIYVLYYSIDKNGIKHVENDEAIRRQISRISERMFNVPLSINDFRALWEENIQRDPAYMLMSPAQKEKLHNELLHGKEIAATYNRVDAE